MILSNFHTHTCFCDGANTPEEIVCEAINIDFEAIGFSGHSYTAFDESYCMSIADTEAYKKTISELKSKYKDKIKIYCGVEQDFFSEMPTEDYDYVIGSVHYIKKSGEYIPVDESAEILLDAVNRLYGGNVYDMTEDYYAQMEQLAKREDIDVIGHFDLVTKFNDTLNFINENNPHYKRCARRALKVALDNDKIIEINTGALQNGLKIHPYPVDFLLHDIIKKKGSILFSSDSHKKNTLESGFGIAQAYAYECGFSVVTIDRANLQFERIAESRAKRRFSE